MGMLSGKYSADSVIPDNDVRSRRPLFQEDRKQHLQVLEKVRSVLTENDRTLVQGALGWLWGASEKTIPIPGFKNVDQVTENATAMQSGPLSKQQMNEIAAILKNEP